jgi:hypothetical protein
LARPALSRNGCHGEPETQAITRRVEQSAAKAGFQERLFGRAEARPYKISSHRLKNNFVGRGFSRDIQSPAKIGL